MVTVPAVASYDAVNDASPVGAGPLTNAPDFENDDPCAGQWNPVEVMSIGAKPAWGQTIESAMNVDASLR